MTLSLLLIAAAIGTVITRYFAHGGELAGNAHHKQDGNMTTNQGHVCGCRCGGTPARGKFLPGHDSKIVPQLEADHGSLLVFWAWYEGAMASTPPQPPTSPPH